LQILYQQKPNKWAAIAVFLNMLRGRELRPTCEIMHLLLWLPRVSDYIFIPIGSLACSLYGVSPRRVPSVLSFTLEGFHRYS